MRGEHFSTESLRCKEPKKGVREMAVGGGDGDEKSC